MGACDPEANQSTLFLWRKLSQGSVITQLCLMSSSPGSLDETTGGECSFGLANLREWCPRALSLFLLYNKLTWEEAELKKRFLLVPCEFWIQACPYKKTSSYLSLGTTDDLFDYVNVS